MISRKRMLEDEPIKRKDINSDDWYFEFDREKYRANVNKLFDDINRQRCVSCDNFDVCEIYGLVEDDYEPEEFGCTEFREMR